MWRKMTDKIKFHSTRRIQTDPDISVKWLNNALATRSQTKKKNLLAASPQMSSQLKSEQSLPISPLKTQHLAQNPKTNTPRKHHVDPFAIPQKHRVSLGRAVPGRHSPSQRWAPLSAHCCRAALAHVAPRDPRVGTAGCTPTGGGSPRSHQCWRGAEHQLATVRPTSSTWAVLTPSYARREIPQ